MSSEKVYKLPRDNCPECGKSFCKKAMSTHRANAHNVYTSGQGDRTDPISRRQMKLEEREARKEKRRHQRKKKRVSEFLKLLLGKAFVV